MTKFNIIECPRDAMQGIEKIIPAEDKTRYLKALLKVGFHTIDFGSFVSPKAVPQMADTKAVIESLEGSGEIKETNLLAIVVNTRGAQDAIVFESISHFGFPLSVSETFEKRNTNKSTVEAYKTLQSIQNLAVDNGKKLVVYLSMGFGNPYGDPYSDSIIFKKVEDLVSMGIETISIADTVGLATPDEIKVLLTKVKVEFPRIDLGAHLHATPELSETKIQAVIDAGCRRIDGAIMGLGGCPFAEDDLVGNIATESIISVLDKNALTPQLDMEAFKESLTIAREIFRG